MHPMEAVAQGAVLGVVGKVAPHGYGILVYDKYKSPLHAPHLAASAGRPAADPPKEFSDADYWERPPACPRCRERYRPIQFDDRYVFVLPAQLVRGDVLRGESVAGGSPTFVVVGSPAGLGRPKRCGSGSSRFRTRGRTQRSRRRVRDLRKRPPVVPKPSRPSQPSPSGGFPFWAVWVAILVISNLLRTCSQNDSHWRTPTPQPTPPKLEMPSAAVPADFPAAMAAAQLVNTDCAAHFGRFRATFPSETVGIAPARAAGKRRSGARRRHATRR